jgi:hypothetical protein
MHMMWQRERVSFVVSAVSGYRAYPSCAREIRER